MKIQAKKSCWIPRPEMSWSAGEIQEVPGEVGKKLLKNNNFVKVSETKPETISEVKQNEQHRKKRSIRDRT